MLVEIFNYTTLKSVGPCYLLCMLGIYVFTVPSCVWARNGAGILRGPRSLFPCLCVLVSVGNWR
jgi:hypothetical protein